MKDFGIWSWMVPLLATVFVLFLSARGVIKKPLEARLLKSLWVVSSIGILATIAVQMLFC